MAYIRWKERRYERIGWFEKVQGLRYASLVHSLRDTDGKIKQKTLAYLGSNPSITEGLKKELEEKYPKIKFNWEKIQKQIVVPHSGGRRTNVGTKSLKWIYEHREQLRKDRNLSIKDVSDISAVYYGDYGMEGKLDSLLKDKSNLNLKFLNKETQNAVKFLKMIYSMKEIKFSKKRVEKNIQKLNDIAHHNFESGSWYSKDRLKKDLVHYKELVKRYSK